MEATWQQIIASGLVWLIVLFHPLTRVFANVEGNAINLMFIICSSGYIPCRTIDAFLSSVIVPLLLLLASILPFLVAPR